jgi:hypothetical protein
VKGRVKLKRTKNYFMGENGIKPRTERERERERQRQAVGGTSLGLSEV